jgi:hypothetical protein
MASQAASTAKGQSHICWSGVILAALVLAISPRFLSGIMVLVALALICGASQWRRHGTDDVVNRKA